MLNSHKLVGFLPSTDLERSKKFFVETLGLRLVSGDDFGLVFDSGGARIRVAKSGPYTPQAFTILGWNVDSVATEARELAAKGVSFLKIPGFPQDELGVWTTPTGAKVAWFKCPEGNTLSISQD